MVLITKDSIEKAKDFIGSGHEAYGVVYSPGERVVITPDAKRCMRKNGYVCKDMQPVYGASPAKEIRRKK